MTPPRMRLHWDVTDSLLEDVRRCEADVLGTWYSNTDEQLSAEYGPYEECTHFIALEHHGEVMGFARLIVPGPVGLKSINDVSGEPWWIDGAQSAQAAGVDLDRTWDIATIGVRAGFEGVGRVAATALYYGMIMALRENEVPWIVAIVDNRVRSLLAGLGLMLNALPGTVPGGYLGSPRSAPVYANLPDMLDHQRRSCPEAHRLIALGVGLDGVTVPPPGSFELPVPACR